MTPTPQSGPSSPVNARCRLVVPPSTVHRTCTSITNRPPPRITNLPCPLSLLHLQILSTIGRLLRVQIQLISSISTPPVIIWACPANWSMPWWQRLPSPLLPCRPAQAPSLLDWEAGDGLLSRVALGELGDRRGWDLLSVASAVRRPTQALGKGIKRLQPQPAMYLSHLLSRPSSSLFNGHLFLLHL